MPMRKVGQAGLLIKGDSYRWPDAIVPLHVPLMDDSFGALRQMTMTAPVEITEAFAAELVFDQWRAGKRM